MTDKKAFGSLKTKMTEIMGAAAEISEKLSESEKPSMDMVRVQINAAYTSLLISEGILFPASELVKKPQYKKYGEHGWVKLTEAQHAALVERYGETLLERAISCIDEKAQLNGNKNKWKDWAAVIHKCIREDWDRVKSGILKAPTNAGEVSDNILFESFMRG